MFHDACKQGWRRTRRSAAARGGGFAGTTLDHAVGRRFVRERALRVAGANAQASRGSRRRVGLPRRPAPKGGGAGFAGVRALVLRCAWMTRDGRKLMLTTKRQRKQDFQRGRSYGGEDWRRWRARGGAPADGVGALGDVEDVNLRQEKTP
jgi:hypothetical protein